VRAGVEVFLDQSEWRRRRTGRSRALHGKLISCRGTGQLASGDVLAIPHACADRQLPARPRDRQGAELEALQEQPEPGAGLDPFADRALRVLRALEAYRSAYQRRSRVRGVHGLCEAQQRNMTRAIYKGQHRRMFQSFLGVCYGPHFAARMHFSIVGRRFRDTKA